MNSAQTSGAVSMSAESTDEPKSNIVAFHSPKSIQEVDLANIETTIESAKSQKKMYTEEVVDFVMDQIDAIFASYGIDMGSSRVDPRDTVMLKQTVEAVAYRFYGIEHPIHEVTVQAVVFTDDDGNPIDPITGELLYEDEDEVFPDDMEGIE